MGKFKVSFTTALFVFSFLVCVIVAVVFVDRRPKNDYDSFYDAPAGRAEQASRAKPANGEWDPSQPAPQASPSQTPVPESALTDLPIDAHLAALAVPVSPAPNATAAPTQNPLQGRSPEDIARALMNKEGVAASLQVQQVPGIAVPGGIATPAGAASAAAAMATPQPTRTYLPMQSNVQGSAPGLQPGASSAFRAPAGTGGGLTNSSAWSPVATQSNNSNLIGVHKLPPSGNSSGLMIGEGRIESGAQPPAGFEDAPQPAGTMAIPSLQGSPASALPGSEAKPLLFPPQSGGDNKYELPPAPTLRPPPIQDPDQRRSEADQTPGSLNPEEASSQAFAISEAQGETTATSGDNDEAKLIAAAATAAPAATPGPEVAAEVKDHSLSKDAALRLARVKFKLDDKKLSKDDEKAETEKAAEQWKEIYAAAEQARAEKLTVGVPEMEHYAGMRPDFDPAEWQMAMEEEGFSAAEIRDQLEAIALSEKLIETKFDEKVKEDEIKKAYEKAPSKYATPRKIRLQEIYKKKPSDKDRAERVEREMRRLQRQAASGTDFGLLARQASDGPTAKRGGHLGWIDPAKDKDSGRDKAIADLKEGEVSEVIDEEDGYRIYRLVEEKAAASDFDGAKATVVAELKKPVREDAFKDVIEKLESGNLNPSPGDGATNKATAAAPKPSPVVTTRVGSSLSAAGFETDVQSADAGAENPAADRDLENAAEKSVAGADAGNQAKTTADAPQDKESVRKYQAQQLLGEMAAKRRAAEQGVPYVPTTEMTEAPASTVMHQPGQQAQLLFAPGSQVQQMAGDQPQSASFPGGGAAAAPVQANMQAPNQTSVNYGNQLPLQAGPQDGNFSAAMQMQAGGSDPRAAMRGAPTPALQTQSESNGWTVTKTRMDNNQGSAQQQAAAAEAQARQMAAQQASAIPPGFEGSTGAQQPQQEQQRRRGIVGSVKSFIGSIGR